MGYDFSDLAIEGVISYNKFVPSTTLSLHQKMPLSQVSFTPSTKVFAGISHPILKDYMDSIYQECIANERCSLFH